MKEKRRYKRFDLLSALAVLGTVAVLLFECFFVFELYTRTFEPIDRFFPVIEEPAAEAPAAPELAEPLTPVG